MSRRAQRDAIKAYLWDVKCGRHTPPRCVIAGILTGLAATRQAMMSNEGLDRGALRRDYMRRMAALRQWKRRL